MRGRELREGFKRRGGLARSRFKTSKRGKSRRGLIRDMDALLRAWVLLRDVTCQVHGHGPCGGPLQVSHIKPKGSYPSLRWEPDNVLLKCYRHHIFWWHRDVTTAAAWFEQTYPERAARLELLCQQPGKVNLEQARQRLTSQPWGRGSRAVAS